MLLYDFLYDTICIMTKTRHIGDMVLGMHDALVSLTGLIAGLVGAGANRASIILTSIIASIAAGLSMGASNYLGRRADGDTCRGALTSGIHTGGAYIVTCVILLIPFMVGTRIMSALWATFAMAGFIIFAFNLCVAGTGGHPFWRRFVEMLLVCVGVSVAAYAIGEFAATII